MLEVTSPALDKLKVVMEEQGDNGSALRVIAVPAENGGVQYMMTMEKDHQKDDMVLELDGVHFLMDSDSAPFLDEATIDYVEELTRGRFCNQQSELLHRRLWMWFWGRRLWMWFWGWGLWLWLRPITGLHNTYTPRCL